MPRTILKCLADAIPDKQRIITLDVIRGIAIIIMAVIHQTYFYRIDPDTHATLLEVAGFFFVRPLFIAVSGMAFFFNEKRNPYPFKLVVHGLVLFCMAWGLDIVFHQSLKVDWDIFQLIGACYFIFGLSDYLGFGLLKYTGLLLLVSVWALVPAIRPDTGIFPIWPLGIYFVGGYLIAHYALSRWNTVFLSATLLLLSALISFYWLIEMRMPDPEGLAGIILSMSIVFLLTSFLIYDEIKVGMKARPFRWMARFGTFPLTLYFSQQFITVMAIRFDIEWSILGWPIIDWLIHSSLLIILMYAATFIFNRLPYLSAEYWLRASEKKILHNVPNRGVFKNTMSSAKTPA